MFQLHDYQRTLVNRARQSYVDGFKSPCIVAPCGAGKSVIISEIAKLTTSKGNRVLFLVHRKELIDQIQNTFQMNGVDLSLVQFGMVQTVVRRLEKIPRPSLIITDENHHGLAKSYRDIYDYFSDVPRIGFTATPIRLNGSGLGDINDILIEEVDAEWLIANGFLSPYKYYAPKLINEEYLKLNNLSDFSNSSMDNAMKENKMIYGDMVKHYQKLADGEQAICYCHSIESSLKAKEEFLENGIKAEHIDAKTPRLERDAIIQKFRDREIQILTNVDLIGEGFDVPDCSTVIMLRPTQSLSLYIQQSMRGMRYKPGKTSIIIDHVANVHRFGLPDEKRHWSLEGKKKTTIKMEVPIKSCSNCYAAYPAKEAKCPSCGFKQEVEAPKDKEVIEVDLQEIQKGDIEITLDFREPSDCKSMGELYDLAKNRGYKRGWAFHQGKLLGFIN